MTDVPEGQNVISGVGGVSTANLLLYCHCTVQCYCHELYPSVIEEGRTEYTGSYYLGL